MEKPQVWFSRRTLRQVVLLGKGTIKRLISDIKRPASAEYEVLKGGGTHIAE